MSGSPIIQDGKPADAVPHVFVNDPARGQWFAFENMPEVSEQKAGEVPLLFYTFHVKLA